MQYFKPDADHQFVGDCIPFFHDGLLHLFWLLDENHHGSKGGLGAHQWAHSTTTDLVTWTHHPLAIAITEEDEASICTGSVFHHDGVYHAYYATRRPDWSEHLSLAVSTDGLHFAKTQPNPFASPGPEYTRSFRDPHVFRDPATGRFHMLVTTSLREPPVPRRAGCLAQLVSDDLKTWTPAEPFIFAGYLGDPECADTFEWHGWHYLLFSNDGVARYRLARGPLGPWTRPKVDSFDGAMARVLKTAAFTGDRRIGVAFLPSLGDDKDDGAWLWGGNAVFREIIQHPDGTLGTRFPAEMVPRAAAPQPLAFEALTPDVQAAKAVRLEARDGYAAAAARRVPPEARITLRVEPEPKASYFGLCVRASERGEQGYELRFAPFEERVELRNPAWGALHDNAGRCLWGVEGLDRAFSLDIVLCGDIIDVCVDGRRTLVARCPEHRGENLLLWAQNADVSFTDVQVAPPA